MIFAKINLQKTPFISMDILTLLTCCSTLTTSTSLSQLAIIAQAILTMTGRVTMLGISRWAEKGGSYRTVQRFLRLLCRGLN